MKYNTKNTEGLSAGIGTASRSALRAHLGTVRSVFRTRPLCMLLCMILLAAALFYALRIPEKGGFHLAPSTDNLFFVSAWKSGQADTGGLHAETANGEGSDDGSEREMGSANAVAEREGSLTDVKQKDMVAVPAAEGEQLRLAGRIDRVITDEDGQTISSIWLRELDWNLSESREQDDPDPALRIILYPDRETGFGDDSCRVGDYILCHGVLEPIGEAGNPGQFDLKQYYRNRSVAFLLKKTRILGKGEDPGTRTLLQILSDHISASFHQILSAGDAAVLDSIVLGERQNLSPELKRLYQDGGISHILAISGVHISLVGMSCFSLLRRRRLSFLLCYLIAAFLLFFYCLMTGFAMTAIRAFIMFGFWGLAQVLGRKNDTPTALAAAAFVLVLYQPGYLAEGGFWLSFGCVASIYAMEAPVRALLLSWKPKGRQGKRESGNPSDGTDHRSGSAGGGRKGSVRRRRRISAAWQTACRLLAPSLSVFLGTLPITCFFFYQYAPWSILINLLVIPAMALVMGFAAVGAAAGLVCVPLGVFLAAPCHVLLQCFQWLCRIERYLPGGLVINGRPELWKIAVYYLLLLLLLSGSGKREDRDKKGRGDKYDRQGCRYAGKSGRAHFGGEGAVGNDRSDGSKVRGRIKCCLFVLLILLLRRRAPQLRVVFQDVGQGDCTLLQVGGRAYLVDCGSSSTDRVWEQRISPCLKYYGISHLDGVFLTHADSDHINGLRQWLEEAVEGFGGRNASGIYVDEVLTGKGAAVGDQDLATICEEMHSAGATLRSMVPGDVLETRTASGEDALITCLYPGREDLTGDGNQDSLVLLFSAEDLKILLTGDLEKEGEERFIRKYEGRSDIFSGGTMILKTGHHGSRYATSQRFLDLVSPELAVISCGKNNRYGHPAQTVLRRLAGAGTKVHRTDLRGACILERA